MLLALTFVTLNIGLSLLKAKSPPIDKLMEGVPLVLVDQGQPLHDRMQRERIDEEDLMEAARQSHGLQRLDQIRYAILENNGEISIVPESKSW